MKQGKGILYARPVCRECSQPIGPGTRGQPAYWAYERASMHYEDYYWYHRACGRRVSARRVAAQEAAMREARAYLATAGKRAH